MTDYQVFISHSTMDNALVQKVLTRLRSSPSSPSFWVDFESLKPGHDWAETIIKSADSADLFLIFGTSAAFESRWVQQEIGVALQKRILDKIPLVILAFDPDQIPQDLKRYQYIDFRDFERGLSALEDFLNTEYSSTSDDHRTALAYRLPPGTVMNFFDCPTILKELDRAELRSRLTDKLSREEIEILWFDVFGERMDDEVPGQRKANCVLELLLKSKEHDAWNMLITAICRTFARVARP